MEQHSLNDILIKPEEKVVSTIGNTYLQSFLATGAIGKAFAILSNKRVYFKGTCYTSTNTGVVKADEERVVDIEDITATGFVHTKPLWALILGIIFFPLFSIIALIADFEGPESLLILIFPMIFFAIYLLNKKSYFQISFAGGSIGLKLNTLSIDEVYSFQRALIFCKDAIKNNESINFPQQNTQDTINHDYNQKHYDADKTVFSDNEYNHYPQHNVKCASCSSSFYVPPEHFNNTIVCPHCNKQLRLK